ncbi:hypothetical protein DSO57_1036376 [Entomophthora muscae]|uniref:Uncharacterized protein n=1 Tax=Entomophthora muscae TaxID=34485 RepID=A0ACC2SP44_9FUNG|nr:hypothetical protein DSO57_1036376 [Entomophthora muscae]
MKYGDLAVGIFKTGEVTQPHRRWRLGGGLGRNNRRNGKQGTQNQTKKATCFPQAANITECIPKKIKIGVAKL